MYRTVSKFRHRSGEMITVVLVAPRVRMPAPLTLKIARERFKAKGTVGRDVHRC
jgi:hypothetical protein